MNDGIGCMVLIIIAYFAFSIWNIRRKPSERQKKQTERLLDRAGWGPNKTDPTSTGEAIAQGAARLVVVLRIVIGLGLAIGLVASC